MKLDADDVRSALRVDDVIDSYQLKARRSGSQYRMRVCPRCGANSTSEAIAIDAGTGSWLHHGCERAAGGSCSGDLFDLVAAAEGLDSSRDFPKVLEVAAKIAGVDGRVITDEERAERRAHRERVTAERQRAADREEAAMLREAKLKASATWQRIGRERHNQAGRAYLRSRGLNPDALIDFDHVRFDLMGNPHVPLWSLDDSEIVNSVKRLIAPRNGEPKVLGLAGCTTSGTLCGRVFDIGNKSTVVIAEGVIDTLTAIQLWPDRVVLGAHGAGRMTRIVEVVAPILVAKGGKLVLVPDGDDVGQRCAIKAGEAAMAAGLEMDATLLVVDLGAFKDLNEAHCAGWKPS